ncbi:MAG: penicillin-binding protein 2 [Anaerolineae bacterium]|jgi:cell division protein FtsI/penicillin-binding protein 2
MVEHARRRLGLVIVLLTAMAAAVVLRLLLVQVVKGADYSQRGREKRWNTIRLPESPRGAIRDTNSLLLAGNQVRYAIEASPAFIEDMPTAVLSLTEILEMPSQVISDTLTSGRPWMVLEPEATQAQGEAVEAMYVSGLDARLWWERIYPQGELTAHVLGFVSRGGDGYYGLEGFYDPVLQPQGVEWEGETDSMRRQPIPFDEGQVEVPMPGADLELTIDLGVQAVAWEELSRGVEEFGAQKGLIVVMDPRDGAILAMVSTPGYDPHNYMEVLEQDWLFVNPAVGFQYEPGSVFKIVTMAAALDSGTVTPETTYVDEGHIEYGGLVTRNWDRQAYGVQDMYGLMGNSLNVGAAWLAVRIGPQTFYRYVRAFGFGELTGIDLQGEASGRVRTAGDLDWHDSDLGTNSYGQGLAVTPIQMISAVAAVANGGELMVPYLVQRQVLPDGTTMTHQPVVRGRPISPGTATALTDILVHVVEENATLAQVPGYRIAGKTGTAQIPVPGGYDPEGTIASFVGYGPAEDPELIILVRLDRPQTSRWGSQTATVVFSRLASRILPILGVPPSEAP